MKYTECPNCKHRNSFKAWRFTDLLKCQECGLITRKERISDHFTFTVMASSKGAVR